MKYIFTLIGLALLFTFIMSNSPANADKQPGKSDEYNGVTFTIDDYQKEDNGLKIKYTVTSESELEEDSPKQPFLDRPSFYVEEKLLNTSFSEKITKINDYKYTGYILLNLNTSQIDPSKLKINIDRISNHVGDWELSLK